MQRILSIDYLRGLMALSVLIYHFVSWSLGVPSSDTILARLGIYAVSLFYVISGIALYQIYADTRWSIKNIGIFAIKRFFRIAPVYWLATASIILLAVITLPPFTPDWLAYFSNFFLIFGFYDPATYVPTGGWSIGNEVVFYFTFPILIILARYRWLFFSVLCLILALYAYFAFVALTPENTLAKQWATYVNPLNQLFLFALGIGAAWARRKIEITQRAAAAALIFSVFIFIMYPAKGDLITLVTGIERLVFTFCCGGACFSLLYLRPSFPNFIDKPLRFLGDTSYSIYLLHGVISKYSLTYLYPLLSNDSPVIKCLFLFIFVLPCTILVSHFIYRHLEKPMIDAGKRAEIYLTNKNNETLNKVPA
ncbi:hypothetical protein BZL41_21680 [Pseudomonas sp. PIC25]|uniref:acyltransferase family protein n=1 Tax=Pseudomonas sp. PIC25 TaxID=1958773 RepID=UPI000BD738D8|nr:acyltransferase [Pseudomonas sp. PIC25]PAU54952.1 hypothetical protein BZL41_21680 [Pseudomonas sp. PIC25]